jgi:hypothetical protein
MGRDLSIMMMIYDMIRAAARHSFSAEQHEDDTLGSLGGMPSFFLSNSIGTYIPSNSGVWLVKQERMLCM